MPLNGEAMRYRSWRSEESDAPSRDCNGEKMTFAGSVSFGMFAEGGQTGGVEK